MSAKRADEINLSDPRINAAMKILGIKEENLRPKECEVPKGSSEARETMARVRYEKQEALRQRWLKEVKDAAAAIDEADLEALGPSTSMPSQSAQNFDNLSYDRLEKQREKLEEQRKRNRSEIQRALEEKMNGEQKAESEKKREEDRQKRLLELRKDKQIKLQSQVDKRKERTSKNNENLLQIAKTAREKMRELDTKLKTTCRMAWEKAQSARIGDEQKRRERREHMDRTLATRDHEDELLHTKRMEAYRAQIDKEESLEKKLEEKKEERLQKAETSRAKFAERIRNLHAEHADEEMKKHNKGFKDLTEKLDSGKARAEELMKLKISTLVDVRTNREAKAQMNQQTQREEDKKKLKEARKKFGVTVDSAGLSRSKNQTENRYKVAEGLDITSELVQTNKERINLAEDHRREQAIARVKANTARNMTFQDERAMMMMQRKAIQKENLIDKNSLRIALGGIRDPSPKKVNELLKNLDLPLLKEESKGETEGETTVN